MPGHIVALGGGGFATEPENPRLDNFILSLARKELPRVCFIPTASADSPGYVAKFYRAFTGRCAPTDLTLFDSPTLPRRPSNTADLAKFVAEQDVFFVGGGNTANMLAMWRIHGLDVLLREAWLNGAVMSGVSAGMLCWFEGGVTDSFGQLDALNDGLGLIHGTASPHYDSEPGRPEVFRRLVASGAATGYAADDGAAFHFVGDALKEVVSSRPAARAFRLSREGGSVLEAPLPVRYLG